jgi:hypothetical protein
LFAFRDKALFDRWRIIIWRELITEKCGYSEGQKVLAEISNNMVVSEQGQLAAFLIKETVHCGKRLWETDQDMLIYKHPTIKQVEHPTKDMEANLRLNPPHITGHTATQEGHLAYVAYQLENLTYELFLKSYLAICRLRYQRYQSMKYLMQNGHAMYVARMLMNSSSVTGYDAGAMLAVSRCLVINTYQYSINPKIGRRCHSAIPIRYYHNAEWHYAYLQLSTKNIIPIDITGCSAEGLSEDRYIKTSTKGNVLHWSGNSLWLIKNNTFKFTSLKSAESIPNFEHMHLLANLVDHPMEQDFDTLSELIQNSSVNILKMLSIASGGNGNIMFDPTTLSETAIQSVNIMKDITETVLSSIFPLHKIITILVLVITAIILIFILVFVIRCYLQRKRRTLGKRAMTHLKSILDVEEGYVDPIELRTTRRVMK